MRTYSGIVLAAGLVLSLSDLAVTAAVADPLPTDPRLVTGELDNGMRYIVLQHATPPGRAAMWMHVSTGSLNEKDHQRGIAHYLEHMAFNGSENFPPGEVIPFFESIGLTFGQHQNAFTGFDQTVYQLALPNNEVETLRKGMLFFADVSRRLTLLPEEIEEERQVIMEEKRTRLGAQQRIQEFVLARLAPGSLIGERLPIGVEETIMGVQREDFLDYYTRFYTPSNKTLMVVADIDPAAVVEQIKDKFSGGDRKPVPQDQDPRISPYTEMRAIVASDPELTSAEVAIIRIEEPRPPVTTTAALRDALVDRLATNAFNRRMVNRVARGQASFLSARATSDDLFNAVRLTQASAEGRPENWAPMLQELGTELQRARVHGFTQREIDDIKRELIAGAEQFVQSETTMPARFVLMRMNNSVASGEPIMSAEQTLALYRELLPGVTAQEASARFRDLFDPAAVTFVAQLPSTAQVPTEPELLTLGQAAVNVQPEAEAETDRAEALMTDLPEPGRFGESTPHAATQVVSGWLDNGIRVHFREMDTRRDQVTVSINLAWGSILETAANRGITDAAALGWTRPATSALASTDIRDLMTGKRISVGGGGGADAMTLTVSGSPSELETGLQLAHLLLTDPIVEAAALEQWRERQLQEIEERRTNVQVALRDAVTEAVFPPGDPRVRPLTAEQVRALTPEAATAWLREAVAKAPIEVSVVGHMSKDDARPLIERYLGSLAKRERIGATTLDEHRTLRRPEGPRVAERELQTQTPLAIVFVGSYNTDAENVPEARAMELASRILTTRLTRVIREQEQLVYSIGAASQPGRTFPELGIFYAAAPTEPGKSATLARRIDELFAEFAQSGPTDEEVDIARRQVFTTLEESMKEPGFWTGILSTRDYRAIDLDNVTGAMEAYAAITAPRVREIFAKYYTPKNKISVVVRPAAPGTPGSN